MTVALSHGGTTIWQDDAPATELLVGTTDGIVILKHDGNGAWQPIDHALPGTHIHALIHEQQSGRWFAGAYRQGVFASADGGRTWEPRNAGLTVPSVYSLTAVEQPDGHVRLYAGAEPATLFQSDDLGATWTELGALREAPSRPTWRFVSEPFAAHLKQITAAPDDPATLYLSVEVGSLHKSLDAGASSVELAPPHMDVHRTVIAPCDPARVYLTGGAGVFVSPDGGQTWETLLPKQNHIGQYPDLLVYAPSNPNHLYLCASANGPRSWVEQRLAAGGQIARSVDAGATWEPCMSGLPFERFHGSIEAFCIAEAGGVRHLFAGDTDGNIAWSGDGGDSWTLIAQTAPVSKSVHAEMMQGGGPTPLKFPGGVTVINGVRVAS